MGIDLTAYKEQQMRRRINQWLDRHKLASYDALIATLTTDRAHREKFIEYLTINTSSFFRDQRVFDVIEEVVLPAIGKLRRPRIWSAGASIGAEVYSIAMLLREGRYTPSLLLATDLDEAVLQKAKAGIYLPVRWTVWTLSTSTSISQLEDRIGLLPASAWWSSSGINAKAL